MATAIGWPGARSPTGSVLLVAIAIALAVPPIVHADPRPGTSTVTDDPRGIDEDAVTPADVALFVPRVVLTPLRWLLEGTYYPIQSALHYISLGAAGSDDADEPGTAEISPLITAYSSAGVTVGATVFDSDLLGHQERLALTVSFLGRYVHGYRAELEARHLAGTFLWLDAEARYEDEDQLHFFGIGERGPESRYQQQRVLGHMRAGTFLFDDRLGLGASFTYNHRRFSATEDSSITRLYPGLPGFADGTDEIDVAGEVVLDLRREALSGFILEAFGGGVASNHSHWGVDAAGIIDLFRGTRLLVLRASIEAVDGDSIPFADLPQLGGPSRLRGYALDTFRDQKAVLGSIAFHYPIHELLRGHLFFDVGRVANDYGEIFTAKGWRAGGGGGLCFLDMFRIDLSYGDGLYLLITTEDVAALIPKRSDRL